MKKLGKSGNHRREVAPQAKERLSDYRRTFINIHGSLPWTIWLMYQLLTRYLHTSVFRLMHHIFNHTAQPTNLYSILSKCVRHLIKPVSTRSGQGTVLVDNPRGKMTSPSSGLRYVQFFNDSRKSFINSRMFFVTQGISNLTHGSS